MTGSMDLVMESLDRGNRRSMPEGLVARESPVAGDSRSFHEASSAELPDRVGRRLELREDQ